MKTTQKISLLWQQTNRKYSRQSSARNFFTKFLKKSFIKSPLNYEVVKPETVSPIIDVPQRIPRPDYAKTGLISPQRTIDIKSDEQIEAMRVTGRLARKILNLVNDYIKVGLTTDKLDRYLHEAIIENGAYPSPLHYKGFPKAICTSVNNVVCHGIPDSRPLKDGDIVTVDVTVYLNNFHGDCSQTFMVGNVDESGQKLVKIAEKCRDDAIKICKPGQHFSAIGKLINTIAKKEGFKIVPIFCGHGIGTYFHGPPQINHIDNANNIRGVMRKGMTFTIEPVLSEGSSDVVILEDGWTAVSVDNSRSAQFEHTILITNTGVEILTK